MFEEYTFDYLLNKMLSNVSDDLDKREGSVIYDAVAPAALELANFYIALDMVMNEVFADSASYYYLIKRVAERNIYPKEETYSIGKMVVTPTDTTISAGDRFNLDTLNYEVVEPIENEDGAYKIQCEIAGTVGNQQLGTLLPIEYIEGLETAKLTEILIPGEDEEDVESLRERYFASFTNKAFGGNKTDYINKVNDIDGVGGCKVIRMWENGYNPASMIPADTVASWIDNQSSDTVGTVVYEWLKLIYDAANQKLLTVGGTIKVIIISSEFKAPSDTLVNTVQELLDPVAAAGEGDGLAPIGHVVNVIGVKEMVINVSFTLAYDEGYAFADLKTAIEESIDSYFEKLRHGWTDSNNLTIRISQIEASIINLDGVLDISDTKINDVAENLTLDADYIPIRGEING